MITKMIWKVYKITNANTGEFYIGITNKSALLRFCEHAVAAIEGTVNWPLQRAMSACHDLPSIYTTFKLEILFESENRSEAYKAEKQFIWDMNPQYNSIRYKYEKREGITRIDKRKERGTRSPEEHAKRSASMKARWERIHQEAREKGKHVGMGGREAAGYLKE